MKNKDLLKAADKFGTPCYVYDTSKIKKQYDRLINSFKTVKNLKINYAVKALSNLSILKYINYLGAGIDTVSIQEVLLGIKAGFSPENIIYTPNGVSIKEIIKVSKMGVNINIDNLNMLEQFGSTHSEIPVCIRINPHVMAGGNNKISVGHIDSKFGISIHQIPLLLRIVKNTNIKVNGIHMHTGSDILDIEVFIHAAEILFETASKFENLEFIDFGSGFKVPYSPGDNETNIEELGFKLSKRFNEFCDDYGKELTLTFEPGKFLVSEAGNFLDNFLESLISNYIKRINYYVKFELIEINNLKIKKVSDNEIKKKEGIKILEKISKDDQVILFDERGKTYSSTDFSKFIENNSRISKKNIVFVVGGAYGFSENIYVRSNATISLSKMTFTHQIIRLFIVEQLYRAFTIINDHPYHNQ